MCCDSHLWSGKHHSHLHPWKISFGPRGFLKFYMLKLLQEKPMSGYELMNEIEKRTFGAWRPTSGSIYPTLMEFEDAGEIEEVAPEKRKERGKRTYKLTHKGQERLAEWRRLRRDMRTRVARWRTFWREFYEPSLEESIDELNIGIQRLEGSLSEVSSLTKEEIDELKKKLTHLNERFAQIVMTLKNSVNEG